MIPIKVIKMIARLLNVPLSVLLEILFSKRKR